MSVRVGIASLIFKDNKILLGMRKGAHGHLTWAAPGGHLEFNESPHDCAIRETKEETGLEISDVTMGPWTNDFFAAEQKHYITLYMLAKHKKGEPEILEPNKCEKWEWFHWEALPNPLFIPLQNLIGLGYNLRTLQNYLNA